MRTRVELLLLLDMFYSKQPLDHPQIISLLKQRNLLIADDAKAIEQLKIISYFRLANYLRPMELDKTTHVFKPNSHFENAINLYYFDKKLRALIFTAIQSFEIALRSKMIHHFSLKYGAFWIIDRGRFSDKKIFSDCTIRIQQEVYRSKEDFLQEHFDKYDEPIVPPAWKTLEVVSFGTLSRILCNLSDNALKKKIAREFNLPQHLYLESWSKSLVALRNTLAHHSRTWNRIYPIQPQLPQSLKSNWIDTSSVPKNKLYALLSCLAFLQDSIHPGNDFKQRLKQLVASHPNVDVAAMGFPANWINQPLWKN
ncbi:MAG: Abi family protein [Muribaculaceae bacterium]|nr:Abi family protein [Muribaculaceae bacterium]